MTNEEMGFNKADDIVSTLKYDYLRKLPACRVNEIRSRITEALRQKEIETIKRCAGVVFDSCDCPPSACNCIAKAQVNILALKPTDKERPKK